MKIFSLNVEGYKRNKLYLSEVINDEMPMLFFLQETWLPQYSESALSSATGSAQAALLRSESRLVGSSSAVDPSDLQLDRVLGVGTFGFVKLAYTAGDGQQTVFAVKCMSKDVIRCDPPFPRNHVAVNSRGAVDVSPGTWNKKCTSRMKGSFSPAPTTT